MTAAVLEYKPTLSHGWFLVAIIVASYPSGTGSFRSLRALYPK